MSYIVEQKIKGNIYLYEVTSYWDKEKKQSRQKRKYLGPKNKSKNKKVQKKDNLIFHKIGNIFLLNGISDKMGLSNILKNTFSDDYNEILSLAFFSIDTGSPYYLFPYWEHENMIAKVKKMHSSDISNLFRRIGENEKGVYKFFENWIQKCNPQSGIYFDISSISSYAVDIDFVEWGYNRDKEKLPQTNIGLVCTEDTELPLYYNIYPGSIPDTSTLENTIKYLKSNKLNRCILILDRGFCSKKNILKMSSLKDISFIQPLTFSSKQVSKKIRENRKELKNLNSIFKYNEEIIYHTKTKYLIEKEEFIAHIFYNEKAEIDQKHNLFSNLLDIEKGFTSKQFTSQKECMNYRTENIPQKFIDFFKYNRTTKKLGRNVTKISKYLYKAGFFILLTNNEEIDKYEILKHYRKRDIVEKMFDVEKNQLDTKRIRCHSNYCMKGRLFLKFIALILHCYISDIMRQNKLFTKFSVKELLAEIGKIKHAKIKGESIITEISKTQRDVLKHFEITPEMIKNKHGY